MKAVEYMRATIARPLSYHILYLLVKSADVLGCPPVSPDISRIFLYLYPHVIASRNTSLFMSVHICRLMAMEIYSGTTAQCNEFYNGCCARI